MKLKGILIIISLLFAQITLGSEYCENIANNSSDPIVSMAMCMASGELDPNNELKFKCTDTPEFINAESCIDEDKLEYLQRKVASRDPIHEALYAHCESAPQSPSFCFNGKVIRDEGKQANKMMMSFLCSDEKIPKGVTLAFGPCELGDRLKTEEESCFCQYVNGNEKNGLAFHCTGLVD